MKMFVVGDLLPSDGVKMPATNYFQDSKDSAYQPISCIFGIRT